MQRVRLVHACTQWLFLQADQADLLRDLDEGQVVSHNAIKELHQATGMSFWPTKEMDHAIGHSMTALVATERHLWLNLYEIKEKDKSFLLDAPLSPPALFGDEFSSVVERFHENGFTTVSGISEIYPSPAPAISLHLLT